MAASGVVSGKDGLITFAGGYDAKCSEWTLNLVQDPVECTALGDDYRVYVAGIKAWSGTFTTLVDTADVAWATHTGGTVKMTSLGFSEAVSEATFTFDQDAVGGTFSGSILVTGCTVNPTTAGGGTSATFDFNGSGALTLKGVS